VRPSAARPLAWPLLLLAFGPGLAAVVVFLARSGDAAQRFQMGAVGLVVAAVGACWCLRPSRARVGAAVGGVVLLTMLHVVAGGRQPLSFLGLAVSVTAAAGGVAALGRRSGLPWPAAGAVAMTALAAAWTGLLWADLIAERVPQAERAAVRRAVLAGDALTALAYGPADHDRLHEPAIYGRVPLASSVMGMPDVGRAAWGHALVAVLAVGLAAGPRRRR
jgi:hypothetical protein